MPNVGDVNVRITANTSQFSAAMSQVSKSLSAASAKLTEMGTRLTLSVSAPLAFVGAQALRTAGQFQEGMNKVRALTGATGSDFQMLRTQALELGRTTQFTARDSAEAMGFMAQAGFDTQKIYAALPDTLKLAASAQLDMATSADIVTNIMSGFNQDVSELPKTVDVLVKAFTSANTNLSQLAQALKFVGPVASGAGVAFEETTAALALMGNAGLQATLAGTGLRQIIAKLAKPSKEATKALAELGIVTKNERGELFPLINLVKQFEEGLARMGGMAANTARITSIFGVRAGPAMQTLISQGSAALEKLSLDLQKSGGIAEKIANVQMEGYAGAMKRLVSSTEGLQISIGTALIPIFERFSGTMTNVNQALIGMDSSTRNLFIAIAGIGIVVGPVLLALGLLMKFITPFALLSAAALTVGVVATSIWTNWAAVAPHLSRIWAGLQKDFLRWVASMGGTEAVNTVRTLEGMLVGAFSKMRSLVLSAMNFITLTLTSVWPAVKAVWRGDTAALRALMNKWLSSGLIPVINQVERMIAGFVKFAWQQLPETWKQHLEGTRVAVAQWWDAVKGLLTTVPDFIKQTVITVWDGAQAVWAGDLAALKTTASKWYDDGLKPTLLAMHDFITATVATVWSLVPAKWTPHLDKLADLVERSWNGIRLIIENNSDIDWGVIIGKWIKDFDTAIQELKKKLEIDFVGLAKQGMTAMLDVFANGLQSFSAKFPAAKEFMDKIGLTQFLEDSGEKIRVNVAKYKKWINDFLSWLGGLTATTTVVTKIVEAFEFARDKINTSIAKIRTAITDFLAWLSGLSPTGTIFKGLEKGFEFLFGDGKEEVAQMNQQLKDLSANADKAGHSLAAMTIPQQTFQLGELDPFKRGIDFPGQQPEILANGSTRGFEKPIREATEFQLVLEQVTTDLEGMQGLLFEMERFTLPMDQVLKMPTVDRAAFMSDFTDMSKAVNLIWKATRDSLDGTTRGMAQDLFNTWGEISNTLIGNSIIPDMLDAIKKEWKEAHTILVDTSIGTTSEIEKTWNQASTLGAGLGQIRANTGDLSNTYQILGRDLQGTREGLDATGQAFRMFGEDFASTAVEFKSGGIDVFESLEVAIANLLGTQSEATGPIISALEAMKATFSDVGDFAGLVEMQHIIDNIKQALDDTGNISLPTADIRTFSDVMKDLADDTNLITAKTNVLGSAFDTTSAEVQAYQNALIELQLIQIQGGVLTDEQISQMELLQEKLKDREGTKAFKDGIKEVGNVFKGSIDEMVRGVLRGTQTVGQLWDNMTQNMLVSLTSKGINRVIDGLINQLLDLASAANNVSSGFFGGGGGGGGGFLGSLVSLGISAFSGGVGGGAGGFASTFGSSAVTSSTLGSFGATPSFSGLGVGSSGASFSGLGSVGLSGGRFAGLFAEGGSLPSGSFGIVGEKGPEILTAGASGNTVTPLSPEMFGRTEVIVNVINNSGEPVRQDERDNSSGGKTLDIIIGEAVRRDAINGGPGIRGIQRALGVSRAGGQR